MRTLIYSLGFLLPLFTQCESQISDVLTPDGSPYYVTSDQTISHLKIYPNVSLIFLNGATLSLGQSLADMCTNESFINENIRGMSDESQKITISGNGHFWIRRAATVKLCNALLEDITSEYLFEWECCSGSSRMEINNCEFRNISGTIIAGGESDEYEEFDIKHSIFNTFDRISKESLPTIDNCFFKNFQYSLVSGQFETDISNSLIYGNDSKDLICINGGGLGTFVNVTFVNCGIAIKHDEYQANNVYYSNFINNKIAIYMFQQSGDTYGDGHFNNFINNSINVLAHDNDTNGFYTGIYDDFTANFSYNYWGVNTDQNCEIHGWFVKICLNFFFFFF